MLALTGPVILAFEASLSGVCGLDDQKPLSVACVVGRWLYEFGWVVAIALWLVVSVAVIHTLARRHWNAIAAAVWGVS